MLAHKADRQLELSRHLQPVVGTEARQRDSRAPFEWAGGEVEEFTFLFRPVRKLRARMPRKSIKCKRLARHRGRRRPRRRGLAGVRQLRYIGALTAESKHSASQSLVRPVVTATEHYAGVRPRTIKESLHETCRRVPRTGKRRMRFVAPRSEHQALPSRCSRTVHQARVLPVAGRALTGLPLTAEPTGYSLFWATKDTRAFWKSTRPGARSTRLFTASASSTGPSSSSRRSGGSKGAV